MLELRINRIAKDQSLRQHGSWRQKSKTLSATQVVEESKTWSEGWMELGFV